MFVPKRRAVLNKRARRSESELGVFMDKANRDPLTGVKSKNAYTDIEEIINQAISEGRQRAFAVAVCDVNGLKYINDTYGHKAGDEYIKSACMMVCKLFQHSPVFRIGGDEFVVLMEGDDFENRAMLMERLHSMSEDHIGTDEAVVAGGISEFNAETDNRMSTVFERADALMYEDKQLLKSKGAISR